VKVENRGEKLFPEAIWIWRCTCSCVFLFIYLNGYSQDCTANLDQAKASYQDGKLYEIPPALEVCLQGGFTREQRVEAYELLSLTYLYIDDPDKADESYLNLLRADPEWRPDSTTEIDIDFLSKKFKTTPIFTVYPVKVGANVSFISVIHDNGTDNTSNSSQNYKPRWGGQIGTGIDWNISDKFSLGGELWFSVQRYRFNNKFFPVDSLARLSLATGDSLVIDFNHIGLKLPILLRYTHRINLWYPYVYGGYAISYFVSSSGSPSYFDINGTGEDRVVNPDIGRTLDLGPIRNSLNHSVLFGAGVKYRMGYKYLLFEIRYSWGLNNILNDENQFDFGPGGEQNDIRELTFRYGQVDDDFRINNLSFNLGFVYPLYKPRRIEKKSGGIFKNLFRKKNKSESGEEG